VVAADGVLGLGRHQMLCESFAAVQYLHQLDQASLQVGVVGGEHVEGNRRVANRVEQLGLDDDVGLHFDIIQEIVDAQGMEEVDRKGPPHILIPHLSSSRTRRTSVDESKQKRECVA